MNIQVSIFKGIIYLMAAILLLSVSSCHVTKKFREGETLLVRNKVKFISAKKIPEQSKVWEDLTHIAAQRPNTKVFGFLPLKLWLYSSANQDKETKFRWWIKNKVGEPPVIFDNDATDKSDRSILNYMQNYGYLNARVTHVVVTRKKKTTVTYTVDAGTPWKFGDIEFPSSPFKTDSFTQLKKPFTLIRKGDRFDVTKLKAERERIETDLKNAGFYYFTRDFLTFDLDTTKSPFTVNVKERILQPSDSVIHQQYSLNDFFISTETAPDRKHLHIDTITQNEFHFIQRKKIVKYSVIQDAIFFKRGQLYSKENYTKTLRRFGDLGAYKFITIDYVKNPTKDKALDVLVSLVPAKKQTVSADVQANVNLEGFFGMAASLSYKNRNLFKRSDLFSVDLTTGVQFQYGRNEPVSLITTDFSANVSYYFAKFLFPFINKEYFKDKSPKTRISLRYAFENRYDFDTIDATGRSYHRVFFYTLHSFNATFGYEWNQNAFKRHLLNPISFSLFLIPKKGISFVERLAGNPSLASSYQEQFIFGPNYTFIYNNQRTKNDKKNLYFRTTVETAGNVLMAGFSLANIGKNNPPPYKIGNLEFSEFVRGEFDLRGFYKLNNHSSFAGRSYLGVAYAYGNSKTIPFVKQFFVGGPNSLRGFLVREIGPGSYVNPLGVQSNRVFSFFNQTGDLKIELNGEFRFDIYKWLKSALFMDVGNVWLIRKDDTRPLGNFAFNRFWNEFAVDIGAGIRLDFNFFVVRFDYGIPIRDPRIQSNNKWTIQQGQFNLAIGYPF
ncbi:MAG: BamA/TamA family outer membrane protein [Chitinophagales bacterium]